MRKNKGQLIENKEFRNRYYVFKDRLHAGKILADMIKNKVSPENAILFAIPSGGVPVGYEIAKALKIPFDLLIVRKIQIPWNTEAGFGSIGPDFEVIIDENLVKKLNLTKEQIEKQIEKTKEVIKKRNDFFRGGKEFPNISNKEVIIVDDGVASGYTMAESLNFVKKKGAKKVILAIPTAPEETIERLLLNTDLLICANIREYYPFAVADAYENWYDLTDTEVIDIIKKAKGGMAV